MPIPVHIDEKRVIVCHSAGLSIPIIAKRFGCSTDRIKAVFLRNGLVSNTHDRGMVVIPGNGRIRRRGHCWSLGD